VAADLPINKEAQSLAKMAWLSWMQTRVMPSILHGLIERDNHGL
jgi:hypothetical protein